MVSIALVDFGNTLADQTFFRRDCERFPSWTEHYVPLVNQLRPDWDTGRLSSRQLAERIAIRLGADPDDVHDYMRELCTAVTFYPTISRAVRQRHARGGRQALVTVNPDIFTEVAANYALHDHFDAIVTSWQHGEPDKAQLCHQALALLGDSSPSDTVLIDDLDVNVQAWTAEGGTGYLFRDDETFAEDVRAGRLPVFSPADLAPADPADHRRPVPRPAGRARLRSSKLAPGLARPLLALAPAAHGTTRRAGGSRPLPTRA